MRRLARVLNKFQESGFEKVERLIELRETYATRVRKVARAPRVTEELQEINKEVSRSFINQQGRQVAFLLTFRQSRVV